MVELVLVIFPVTQSSSLSAENHEARCVVGSEPISIDCHWFSMGIFILDKLQLTVPMLVVWL